MSVSTSISNSLPDPDKPALETQHPGLLMVALILASIMQVLDVTIANVALPHMQSSLGATMDTITWVLTSFIIAMVMATPLVGWVSDRFGSRHVFITAIAGFLLSSMLCGAAGSLTEMVIFRILQGISAAFIGPMTQTALLDTNPPKKHGSAMMLWGVTVMIAPICGPVIGGFLTDTLNWRWVFYINLPLGIPVFLILAWLLPSRPIVSRKLDRTGVVILAVGLGTLQLILDRGQHLDWLQSPEIIIELIIALSAFWMFMVHTINTKNPLYPGELFKSPNFISIFFLMFALGLSNVAIASILPMMYQTVYQYTAFDTGILMISRGVGVFIAMMIAGRVMYRTDVRYLTALGYLIAAIAMWRMAYWSLNMGSGPLHTIGFIQGFGIGLIFSPMNMAALSSLKPEHRPDGSSLMGLMRNLGGSFGISAIITMLSRNTQTSHADLTPHINAYTLPNIDLASTSARLGEYGGSLLYMIDAEINRQALMIAYLDNFFAISMAIVVIAVVPLLMKPIRLGRSQ